MPLIMLLYYGISAYILLLLFWNFFREEKSVNNLVLYLLISVPLLLRIFRWK